MRSATVIFFLLHVTYSYTLNNKPGSPHIRSITNHEVAPRTASCGFTGNPDLYGIGIRIGYYTQALSVWIANYFVLSESKSLRSVNLLFMLALFIGLIWLSHRPSEVYAVEAYLLSHLLVVTWSVGVFDKARFSRKYWRFSPAPIILQRIILSGLVGYDVWFWWRGLDLMKKTPCGTFVFVIVKINLYGWFRSLAKIASAVSLFGHVAASIGAVAELIQHKYTRPVSSVDYYQRLRDELESNLGTSDPTIGAALATKKDQPQIKGERDDVHLQPPNLTASEKTVHAMVELAIHTPLPESPQQGEFVEYAPWEPSLFRSTSDSSTKKSGTELPSLNHLLDADAYLEEVLSITTSNLQPRKVHLFSSSIRFTIPSWKPQWLHLSQLRQRLPHRSVFYTRPFRIWILITLFQHVYEHRSYPLYVYPKMLETAVLSQHHKSVSFKALKTMMAIRTVRIPDFVPPAAYLLPAINRFLTIIVLMLSVELCIRWNGISGMGNFGAVGQLVPAILGIGGLVRVLWIWRSRRNLSEFEEDGIGKGVRECAELYEQLKERSGQGAAFKREGRMEV